MKYISPVIDDNSILTKKYGDLNYAEKSEITSLTTTVQSVNSSMQSVDNTVNTHCSRRDNPHEVTATQIGIENKDTLDKLSEDDNGKLLYDGNPISGGSGGDVNVQADWNQTNTSSDSYIKNKPTSMPASDVHEWAKAENKPTYTASEVGALPSSTKIPTKVSELTNDRGYLTEHQDISGKVDKVEGSSLITSTDLAQIGTNKSDISTLKGTGTGSIDKMINDKINEWATQLTDDGLVNTYAEAINWISTHAGEYTTLLGAVSNKSDKGHTHDQYLTEHQNISGKQDKLYAGNGISIENDMISAKIQDNLDSNSATDSLSANMGKFLGDCITSIENRLDEIPVVTKTSQLLNDGVGNEKGSFAFENDIPTKTSDLTNDSDFITINEVSTSIKNVTDSIPTKTSDLINDSDFITINEVTDSIPTKTSELTNDSYFISDSQYVHTDNNYTDTDKTAISTISDKADKTEIPQFTLSAIADANVVSNVSINGNNIEFQKGKALVPTDIVDNLSSTSTTQVLSANQGKVLNEKIPQFSVRTVENPNVISDISINGNAVTITKGKALTSLSVISQGIEGANAVTGLSVDDDTLTLYKMKKFAESSELTTKISNPSTKSNGQVLTYDAPTDSWIAQTLPESGGTSVNVVDNLTSTSTTDALSANQGKVLKSEIDDIHTMIGTLNSILEEL